MPLDESLRLVDFSVGGRPFGVLDLEDGTFFSKLKGSVQVRSGQRTVSQSRLPGRYGGSRAVGAREENAELAWTCAVLGASVDEALDKAGELLATLADMSVGRMVEFRARGASFPTFLDIRGPGVATPLYDAVLLEQQKAFLVELAVPVAPLGEMHRMDVYDDYSVDSIADLTFDAGGGTVTISGGRMNFTDTTEKRWRHTGRGYRYGDGEVVRKVTFGASLGTGVHRFGNRLCVLDDLNYLRAFIRGDNLLAIGKVDGGVATQLGSTVAASPVIVVSTAYWLRFRKEGDVLRVELFSAEPTPNSTVNRIAVLTHTLVGADATKFGAGVEGDIGGYDLPFATDWHSDDLRYQPFIYNAKLLPARIALGGTVPGDAPALVEAHVTPSGGAAAPVWALLAWAARAGAPLGGSVVPFGIIEAETGTGLSGWAVTADGDYRGGSGLQVTASGAGSASAEWVVDPSTLAPDPFTLGELDLELWARVEIASALVSPKLVLSAKPEAGTSYGTERFASPFGLPGKLLVKPSSGTHFRPVRLGTLTVLCDPDRPLKWRFRLAGSWAAGSSGVLGVDQLWVVCVAQRAYGPTGRVNDGSYPKFVPSTSETTKIVRPDLSGALVQPGSNPFPDHGLGGEPLEFPPGLVDVLVALSSVVPDDPTASTASDQEDYTASCHFAVTPRVRLLRGS